MHKKVLAGKRQGKRPFIRPRLRWENHIITYNVSENKGVKVLTGFKWLRICTVLVICEHDNELPSSLTAGDSWTR